MISYILRRPQNFCEITLSFLKLLNIVQRDIFSSKHVGVKNTTFLWTLILTQKLLGNYASNFIQKLSLWEWSIIKIDLFFVFKSCGQVFKSNLDFGVPNGNEVVNLGSLLPPQKLTTSHGPRWGGNLYSFKWPTYSNKKCSEIRRYLFT